MARERPPLDPAIKAEILQKARALVDSGRICLLTSSSADGFPMLRGMGYLNDGWTIYMSTTEGHAKEHEIAANPRVSCVWIDQSIRRDHFVQLFGLARQVHGEELEVWQRRRFEKYPHEIEAYDARQVGWVGWVFEPVRLRTLGYIAERGFWGENPIVFGRKALGVPPLPTRAPPVTQLTEFTYDVADLQREVEFWDRVGLTRVVPGLAAADRLAIFDAGGPRLQVRASGATREPPRSAADHPEKVTLLVTDLDTALDAIATTGGSIVQDVITLDATETTPRHRYCYIATPGGQLIGFVEGDASTTGEYRRKLGMRALPPYWP